MADLSTAEAVESIIRAFNPAFISSSPPCQRFSDATPTANRDAHPDLIASTRAGILASGVPGWIENVASRRVPFTGFWVMLCGSMFPETYHLKRHRRFELLRWKIAQPWHNDALCRYGSDAHDAESCALCADFGAGDERRVPRGRDDVSAAGKGPQGAADRHERRPLVTVCGELPWGTSPGGAANDRRKRAIMRETVTPCGTGGGTAGRGEKDNLGNRITKRDVVSVIGTNGSTPAFGGDKKRRAEFRAGRTCVGVFGGALDGPGQLLGQNRAGPKVIRWRQALGWMDGPQDRYALSQAVPPCYAEFLGRKFLERA